MYEFLQGLVRQKIERIDKNLIGKTKRGAASCRWNINMILFRVNSRLQRLRLSVLIAVAVVLGAFWCARQFQKSNASANPWDGSKRSPYGRTEDDPISVFAGSVDLLGAPDFVLAIGDWRHIGYNSIRISADGRCRCISLHTVQVTMHDGRIGLEQRRRGMDFIISPQTLADLRKLLVEIDFFRLKRGYYANVIDGGRLRAMVQASGKQKRVYCNNDFPEPFQKLYKFIFERVIGPREKELQNDPLIDIENRGSCGNVAPVEKPYVQASP